MNVASLEEKKRILQAKAAIIVKKIIVQAAAEKWAQSNVAAPVDTEYGGENKPEENMEIRPSTFSMRPLYSRVDINNDKWLLTLDESSKKKLECPPSLDDGIDADTEAELRYLGCELIQAGAILLKLPQTAAATGQILFQRFYYQKSFVKYLFEHYVMACLLLASKIEEAPRRPRDVYNVFHRLEQLNKLKMSGRPINSETCARLKPRPLDVNYVNAKNNIIKAERRLMATLGFVIHVKHPHKLIISYLYMLKRKEKRDDDTEYEYQYQQLTQKAWSYMNDGLRTDLFLRYTPETIACACIYLASKTIERPIKLPSTPECSFNWFELFDASDRDVETIALMLHKQYYRKRAPNWSRLTSVLDKLKTEKEQAEKAKAAAAIAQRLADSKKDERDENKQRSRSRTRSRSPRRSKKHSRSPVRNGKQRDRGFDRDRVKYDRRDVRRERDRSRDRSREIDTRPRDRERERERRRSRSRDRSDRDRVREKKSRMKEKEVLQTLGKDKRNR